MANLQRDAEKERAWREILSRQSLSGLSVRAFCRAEGLSEASFHAWRRTLVERDGAKPPSFVPVVVTDPAPGLPPIMIDLAGGHVLRLPASTSAAWLAELVLTLEASTGR